MPESIDKQKELIDHINDNKIIYEKLKLSIEFGLINLFIECINLYIDHIKENISNIKDLNNLLKFFINKYINIIKFKNEHVKLCVTKLFNICRLNFHNEENKENNNHHCLYDPFSKRTAEQPNH